MYLRLFVTLLLFALTLTQPPEWNHKISQGLLLYSHNETIDHLMVTDSPLQFVTFRSLTLEMDISLHKLIVMPFMLVVYTMDLQHMKLHLHIEREFLL